MRTINVSGWVSLVGWLVIIIAMLSIFTGDQQMTWHGAAALLVVAIISISASTQGRR